MNEIRKLSLDSSINSFSSQTFGSCSVKEEIDKLSTRWKHLDAQFNDRHNEIIKKKETVTRKLATVDSGSQNNIYLESIPIMEKRLKDLKTQHAEPSNFADISTNMTITKLTDLIENYGSFEILRQNSLSWINDTKAGIHRAKQNIDQMAEESIIYQDEQFLTNLLKVKLLKYYFSKLF
jgi:hypothetical protein